jgi:uncharacterized protein (DUF1800 family)
VTPLSIALNRFGLGYRRGDALPRDPRGWLKSQISRYDPSPPALGDRAVDGDEVRRVVADTIEFRAMRNNLDGDEQAAEDRREITTERMRTVRHELTGDVALRARLALESDTPFMERLVHFWSNHFAVSTDKAQLPSLVGPYEFGAIRPHVAGYFADLLKAASLHPAMLAYLDQFQSQGPDSRAQEMRERRGRAFRGLNENLGREILELHTLGVGGGYTQEDVKELARALTGWTMQGLPYVRGAVPQAGGAAFFGYIHQPGTRTILGRTYADTGAGQALAVLDDLAVHPSTARFIATKLARHFAGDTPPTALVDRLATAFSDSGGHLPTVYEALVDARGNGRSECCAPEARRSSPTGSLQSCCANSASRHGSPARPRGGTTAKPAGPGPMPCIAVSKRRNASRKSSGWKTCANWQERCFPDRYPRRPNRPSAGQKATRWALPSFSSRPR